MNSKAYASQRPAFGVRLAMEPGGRFHRRARHPVLVLGPSSRKRQGRYPGSPQSPALRKIPDTAQAPFRDDEKGPGFARLSIGYEGVIRWGM